MAQRVFLIQVPINDLAAVTDSIRGTQADREAIADDLATRRHRHVRIVALSEQLGAASELSFQSESWDLIRYCLPFIISGNRAEHYVAGARRLEAMPSEEIDAYLRMQMRMAGASVGTFRDPSSYKPPTREALRRWILDKLDAVASLRTKLADTSQVERCAVDMWILLAMLFTSLYPSFWQGNNRWLGAAAFPKESDATGLFERGAAMSRLLPFGRPSNRTSFPKLPKLRQVMCSVGDLAPNLMEPMNETQWRAVLAPWGNGREATGGVAHAQLPALLEAIRDPAVAKLPFVGTEDWVEIVTAAATLAHENNAHLVEGDEMYCWPLA
jgi:hypothetical protein